MTIDPDIAVGGRGLAEDLQAAANLLAKWGEDAWAERLYQSRVRVVSADLSGVDELLTCFGGIGSLNDVYLSATPDFDLSLPAHLRTPAIDDDAQTANDTLCALLSRIWDQATLLRQAH